MQRKRAVTVVAPNSDSESESTRQQRRNYREMVRKANFYTATCQHPKRSRKGKGKGKGKDLPSPGASSSSGIPPNFPRPPFNQAFRTAIAAQLLGTTEAASDTVTLALGTYNFMLFLMTAMVIVISMLLMPHLGIFSKRNRKDFVDKSSGSDSKPERARGSQTSYEHCPRLTFTQHGQCYHLPNCHILTSSGWQAADIAAMSRRPCGFCYPFIDHSGSNCYRPAPFANQQPEADLSDGEDDDDDFAFNEMMGEAFPEQ